MRPSAHLCATLVLLLGLASLPARADPLHPILAQEQAPPGVVFDIADRDPNAPARALPWTAAAAQRLRTGFPELPIAVVTHGREMFALRSEGRGEHGEIHDLARNLAERDGIPVHVCETHAGWRGVTPEDFPAYIDVAAAGPAQVNDYRALGYQVIRVPKNLPAHP